MHSFRVRLSQIGAAAFFLLACHSPNFLGETITNEKLQEVLHKTYGATGSPGDSGPQETPAAVEPSPGAGGDIPTQEAASMPLDSLARIKADIASRYPNNYSIQETLIEANVESWKKLQTNFTGVPDSVYLEIREDVASRYPDNYSIQETLVEAQAESWKRLNS